MSKITPQDVYRQVDLAVNTTIQSEGPDKVTGLAKSVVVGNSDPITTYYSVNQSSGELSGDVISKVAAVFKEITGFDPSELSSASSSEKEIAKKIINYTAFYIFFPIGLVLFIAIWLMVGVGWITWASALYLMIFMFLILYGFNILYRINAENAIDNIVETNLESKEVDIKKLQGKLKAFVAYLPQLIHAIATVIKNS